MTIIQQLAVAILPLLFALTWHEVAHAWVANRLGDRTALMLGHLSPNPIKHIDPIGTIALPLLLFVAGSGLLFGWARPAPITPRNLRQPRRDMALIAAAGPLANLLMALAWGVVTAIAVAIRSPESLWVAEPLRLMGQFGIVINSMLTVINLLPIPPLDGGRVLANFLPGPLAYKFEAGEIYGLVVLVVLLVTGILGSIIAPLIGGLVSVIEAIFGL